MSGSVIRSTNRHKSKVTKLRKCHTLQMLHLQKNRGERKVRKPQWTGSPVTDASLHFHWSPPGIWLGIQVRACQQHGCARVITAGCSLSAKGVCLCVCVCALQGHGFVFFLYFMKHFTPQWGSKCTLASTRCTRCDRATWDLDNMTVWRARVHTHTHRYIYPRRSVQMADLFLLQIKI